MFTAEITYTNEFSKVRILHICVDTLSMAEYFVLCHIQARIGFIQVRLKYLYGETYVVDTNFGIAAFVDITDYELRNRTYAQHVNITRRHT